MKVVRQLAEGIGARPAGGPMEEAAADLLHGLLATREAEVSRHRFSFRGWRALDDASLAIDGVAEMRGLPLPYTRETPPSGVVGQVQFQGLWPLIPGRLACPRFELCDPRGVPLAAVLVYPTGAARPLPNPQPLVSLPTVVIGEEDGRRLRAALAHDSDMQARVSVPAVWEGQLTSSNVIADLGDARRRALVVAHYDSVADSPGANDNASGVAVAIRIADRFRAEGLGGLGIRIGLMGAEEPFLVGSRAYAGELSASGALAELVGCLNLDMMGVGESYSIRRPEASLWDRAASAIAQTSAAGVPVHATQTSPASDHWAFHELGLPSAQLTRLPDDAWHHADDGVARFGEQELDDAADVAWDLLVAATREPQGRVIAQASGVTSKAAS